jgi:predicted nucleic acid-binding protein
LKLAFVDTSAFYAFLDGTDRFHGMAKELMFSAEKEKWHLFTTSFVLHETWALTQARLGWEAVEDWLGSLLPLCEVIWVDERLYERGAARARQAKERKLSLTDCISFEAMLARGCREALADDVHFTKAGFELCQVGHPRTDGGCL